MSGIIIIPILLFYVVFCYVVYRVVLWKTNRWLISVGVFFTVLTFPFWDLMVQQGIEKFYNTFNLLEPTFYEMPERDKDGKIESIGGALVHGIDIRIFKHREILNNLLNELREDNVSDFVEFDSMIGSYKDKTNKDVIVKVNIYNKERPYEIIEKSQARYIQKNKDKYYFNFLVFRLSTTEYMIYDTKKQKIIAKAQTMPTFNFIISSIVRHNILHASGLFSHKRKNYVDEMRSEVFEDIRVVR